MKRINRKEQPVAPVAFFMSLVMIIGSFVSCQSGSGQTGTDTDTDTDTYTSAVQTSADSEQSTDPGTAAHTSADSEQPTDPEATTQADAENRPNRNIPRTENLPEGTPLNLPVYDLSDRLEQIVYRFDGYDAPGNTFIAVRGSTADGPVVRVAGDTVGGILAGIRMPDGVTSRLSLRLTCKVNGNEAPWSTTYIGFRLFSEMRDPTVHDGIWLAVRNSEIGLRVGDFPSTAYIPVDADFASGEYLTVVDNPISGTVSLYAGKEADRLLATLTVDGCTLSLTAAGADEPGVTDVLPEAPAMGGFISLFTHIPFTDVTYEELSVTSQKVLGAADWNGIRPGTCDLFADTWNGIDDLKRALPTPDTVKAPTAQKVGTFYFLWHEEQYNSWELIDHTAAYETGGIDALWTEMGKGQLGFSHYWAQPYFGYYASNDEWVLRKHGAMLAEAGVDFVYIDASNGLLYQPNYEALLNVWSQMREEGYRTPDVAWMCVNKPGYEQAFISLYQNVYEPGRWKDMWFEWDGKPLILFTSRDIDREKEYGDFFTIRYSWAFEEDPWYTSVRGQKCWPWGTMHKQKGGKIKVDGKTVTEQMVVMCGFWTIGHYESIQGRSYTEATGEPTSGDRPWDFGYGLYPQTSGLGLAFQEQFDNALVADPALIMVTGWNEWWAGRWEGGPGIGMNQANQYTVSGDPNVREYNNFTDNLTPEYSRDIEPMKGGFGDNYYMQLCKNVRAYKGARRVETAFGQWAIDPEGSLGQWDAVGPEYRDLTGDTYHRNHLSYVGSMTYTNDTGRNDLSVAKVSSDDANLYFYIECAGNITSPEGEGWMNLFLDTDGDMTNGWQGFDFILNRSRSEKTVSVERFTGDGSWTFERTGEAAYTLRDTVLIITVPKALVGFADSMDFKWADNSVTDGDVMEFLDRGDTAPDGRFRYHFTTGSQPETPVPACLTDSMVVLKSGSYNVYLHGREVMLDERSTRVTALASGSRVWLPVSLLETMGIDVTGETPEPHYGVPYVRADRLIAAAGKSLTVTGDGLILISDSPVTDTDILDTLYRSLH